MQLPRHPEEIPSLESAEVADYLGDPVAIVVGHPQGLRVLQGVRIGFFGPLPGLAEVGRLLVGDPEPDLPCVVPKYIEREQLGFLASPDGLAL